MTDLFFHNALVSALGSTILHSLWQATLLAGLLWFGSRLTTNSVLRYRFAYGTLVAQFFASALTFGWLYEPTLADSTVAVSFVNFTPYAATTTEASWWQPGVFLSWVVVFWLFGLVIGTTRLAISLGRVRGMQREAQKAVPDHFRRLVTQLANRMGYYGSLHLGISDKIDGPALVGHLKPMLLFPIAVINQLTEDQAEAVILHELAHLRRQDHWWNLLQCVIEVLFYYHPIVWWIGARIREEREHCCDDLVLRYGPNRLAYARALLYFEQQANTPATAVALTNNPTGLLGRVKRFLHQQNLPYQMKSRLFLLPLLALIAVVSTAVYAPSPVDEDLDYAVEFLPAVTNIAPPTSLAPAAAPLEIPLSVIATQPDTLPRGRHRVSTYRNGSSAKVTVEDQAITSLEIDGKTIPKEEYDQHLPMVEDMLGQSGNGLGSTSYRSKGLRIIHGENDIEDIEYRFENLGEGLEYDLEDMGESWEEFGESMGEMGESLGEWGESMGELGERLGIRFENFFDNNSHSFRFDLEEGDDFYFDLDSLPPGSFFEYDADSDNGDVIILRNSQRYSVDDLLEDVERERSSTRDTEAEIREMETMIQRLERKKAQMRRDLERSKANGERAKRDGSIEQRDERIKQRAIERREAMKLAESARRDAQKGRHDALKNAEEMRREAMKMRRGARQLADEARSQSPDYEAIIAQLQKEGMIDDNGPVRKIMADGNKLKINGKNAPVTAHQRFLELYEENTGHAFGSNSKITVTFGEF